MAVPLYGSVSRLAYPGAPTSSVVPVPSGVVAGHLILVFFYIEGTRVAVTPPAGFTEITWNITPLTVAGLGLRGFWKITTGADSGNYTFTHPTATATAAVAFRITGAHPTAPIEAPTAAIRDTSSTATAPIALTTTGADRLLAFWTVAAANSNPTFTPPAGFTERIDAGDAFEAATKDQPTAGATGTLSATATVNMVSSLAALVAVVPPTTVVSTGRLVDRWNGTALVPQRVDRWDGTVLTQRIIAT